MAEAAILPASFRDPSGFVYRRDGTLYRQVNTSYRDDYERLCDSGLLGDLVGRGLLVEHEEVDERPHSERGAYKVLRPEPLPFIAYPYEWCFGQLKAAALLTLEIQRTALARGMSLKDASAYNVQFRGARPVFIDTLSFERYREGEPWVAYQQFCRHFLAPLALMARVDVRLGQLARSYPDGVPLDLAASLLPRLDRLRPSMLLHLVLHARSKRIHDPKGERPKVRGFSRTAFLGLLDNLSSAVRVLDWRPAGTEWADYYDDTNYSEAGLADKERLVREHLRAVRPATVWDLGANTGRFSRLAAGEGAFTVSFDIDPAAVERNFRRVTKDGDERLLPLQMDLTNPSPALGWAEAERSSFSERGPADVVMALALVHHLAIGANVPLPRVAEFFAKLGRRLIIEFVPKEDSQVRRLLVVRQDIFADYTREAFEAAFAGPFAIESATPVRESVRALYLMRRRGD